MVITIFFGTFTLGVLIKQTRTEANLSIILNLGKQNV